ncbi:hypothetical protein DMUE_3126 [Dictyocoela muelleri]|nr:hypothetical protein DMUE_3126 [Dictyocoela muelleri]
MTPSIEQARLSFTQKYYDLSSDIYSQILSETDTSKPTMTLCILYIEYANSLINGANEFFVKYLQEIVNFNIVSSAENLRRIDDLEIAWDCLEITKNLLIPFKNCNSKNIFNNDKMNLNFTITDDDKKIMGNECVESLLQKTYFLLGEIQMLDNKFNGAISDYTEALECYKDDGTIHQRIAQCYEFLKDIDNAILYHQKSIPFFDNATVVDLLERIEDLKKEKEHEVPQDIEENKEDENSEREIIDLNACRKKKR